MVLTEQQMYNIHKLILRFLKEQKLYQYRKKNINKVSYEYMEITQLVDRTLARFCERFLKRKITIDTQVIFATEYAPIITELSTQELFINFLKENNITLKHLIQLFVKHNEILSKDEYKKRIEIIAKYKPHIMACLDKINPNVNINNNINVKTLKNMWMEYYTKNVKFKTI